MGREIRRHELPIELHATLAESSQKVNDLRGLILSMKARLWDASRELEIAENRLNCEARLACRIVDIDPDEEWKLSPDGKFLSRED
jgi:hypothetical protein